MEALTEGKQLTTKPRQTNNNKKPQTNQKKPKTTNSKTEQGWVRNEEENLECPSKGAGCFWNQVVVNRQ